MEQKLIQTGIVAKRKPNGEFCTAMPIYRPATPELTERQELLQEAFKRMLAAGLREYISSREEK